MRNFNKDYSLVRFLNAIPNGEDVDVYLNGSIFFGDLGFTQFSPYIYIPKGSYIVEVFLKDTEDNPLIRETLNVNAQELVTVAIIAENDSFGLLPIKEDMELAEGNKSKVRFVHLVPNGRTVNVLMDGNRVFSNVAYTDITPYLSLPPKDYRVDIESSDNNQFIRSLEIAVNPNRIYTFYAIGEAPNFEVFQSLDGASFLA